MNGMSRESATELGYHLWRTGFQPHPDVDDHGRVIGVRMWRMRSGHVEYLTLRESGFAMASLVQARFTYRDPLWHGPMIDSRVGSPMDALRWLLGRPDDGRAAADVRDESCEESL